MRRWLLPVLLGMALPFTAIGARSVSATLSPHACFDYRTNTYANATKWIDSPGTLVGTSGNDVLVGSTGTDIIDGKGGNDIICSAPAILGALTAGDTITGGSGNDDIYGSGTLDGGSGNDFVLASGPASTAKGGSGNDTVRADNGASADGGSGNDLVVSGPGGAHALLGSSGGDLVENNFTAVSIDCGPNVDQVYANGLLNVVHCETQITPP